MKATLPAVLAGALLVAAFTLQAAAADDGWTAFKHAELGYVAWIPPGFAPLGATTDNTGMAFGLPDNGARLIVFGGPLGPDGIRGEFDHHKTSLLSSGASLNIEYLGSTEATLLGSVAGAGINTRIRAECDGTSHLTMVLSWPESARATVAPLAPEIAERLTQVFCP